MTKGTRVGVAELYLHSVYILTEADLLSVQEELKSGRPDGPTRVPDQPDPVQEIGEQAAPKRPNVNQENVPRYLKPDVDQ